MFQNHLHTIAIRTELRDACKKHPFGSVLAYLATKPRDNEHTTVVSEISNHAVLPQEHKFAAKLLADNLRIDGRWYGGRESVDDTKFVFVCLPQTESDQCLCRSGKLYKFKDEQSYEIRFYRLRAKIRCGCTDKTAVETWCSLCDPYNTEIGKLLK